MMAVLGASDLQGGVLLVLARAVAVAAILSVFGGAVFRLAVVPGIEPGLDDRLGRLGRVSAAAGFGAMLVWLVLQAAAMAGADDAAVVAAVALHTRFGHLALAQLAVFAAASVLGRRLPAAALGLGGIVLQVGHSHAAAMGGGWLLASDVLHLVAAGAWLGSLAPLAIVVATVAPAEGARAAQRYSPLGRVCVLVLVATAMWQGWVLIGSPAGLLGTTYGWVALVKLGLLGVLLAFAVRHAARLVPALARGLDRRALVRSIAVEAACGLAVIGAAALLSQLPPAMHVQPVWPFAWRPSLVTVDEDAGFRNEVLAAVGALVLALGLLCVAIWRRGWVRWPAVAGAAATAWFAVPHLDLLVIPAVPTSYYHSPTGFAAAAILQGAALYPAHCAACHGAEGRGDGPAAAGLPVPPADLTAQHLWEHADGELFWWLAHGMAAPDGRAAMPGFAGVLTEDERWDLIDYIRARNAGTAFRASGDWPAPVRAPGVQAQCADGRLVTMDDLRGGYVRIVIGGPAAPVAGVTTVLLDPGTTVAAPGLCVVDDTAALEAYAVVAGSTPGPLRGAAFLVDPDGWLRAMQQPGWRDPVAIAAVIDRLRTHRLAAPEGMPMDMKM